MLTAADLNRCLDCGRRRALKPATICEPCQMPRLRHMIDTYKPSGSAAREDRAARRTPTPTPPGPVETQRSLF